jgi:hypothetical protein
MEQLLQQILQGINEMKEEQKKQGQRLDSVEKRLESIEEEQKGTNRKLKAQNDILQSFKYDTDLLIEKNAKLEFKVNNIEKRFEA